MKSVAAIVVLAVLAPVQGFAPVSQGRVETQLRESLFDKVFGLDLFAPVKDQNDYGARGRKQVSAEIVYPVMVQLLQTWI
jgi:hypothetical protein